MLDKYRNDDLSFWRGARRLLVKISVVSGIIPRSLTVQGVTLLEKEAVFGGGFADIYKASYKNNEVALKRMRVFQRGKARREIHKVRVFDVLVIFVSNLFPRRHFAKKRSSGSPFDIRTFFHSLVWTPILSRRICAWSPHGCGMGQSCGICQLMRASM